jgi:hypothetical protein
MDKTKDNQPLPYETAKALVLLPLTDKGYITSVAYEHLILLHSLEERKVASLKPEERKAMDGWLRNLGKKSFRDLDHLLTIAALIDRVCLIKQGKALALDAKEEEVMNDWLAQSDYNRKAYKHMTDPLRKARYDAIDLDEVKRKILGTPESKWKKFWKRKPF